MHKNSIALILILVLVISSFMFARDYRAVKTNNLITSVDTTEVVLQNGETYDIVATSITKEIDGKKYDMLAYNGMVPGPTIRVTQGDTATIHVVNKTKFPTLFHSHGVRADNQYDGTHLTQSEIKPGESFDYVLKFPDAGVYWYHPHVREDQQQSAGLYGNFIVTPKDLRYWPPADHEEVIMLSDVLIEDGVLAPYSDKYITHALMGRFGNTILINGKTKESLVAEPGEVHRLYVTNAATARPFNFRIAGVKMKLVGGDNGHFERETFVEGVILGPGDRAILDVYFEQAGSYAIEHVTPLRTYALGTVAVSGEPVNAAAQSFSTLRTDADLVNQFTLFRKNDLVRALDKSLSLLMEVDMNKIMGYMPAQGGTGSAAGGHEHDSGGGEMGMGGMGNMSGMNMGTGTDGMSMMGMMGGDAVPKIEWEDNMGAMNVYSTSNTVKWVMRDNETGKQNMDIVWKFKKDSIVKVRITNELGVMHPMQHPIHFHGNRFVVLSTNGIPNDNMSWEDTTMIGAGDTIDVLLETTEVGKWVDHCHIAEHMHSGMMMEYDVE